MIDRRKLLKSIGALGLAPMLPTPAVALSATTGTSIPVSASAFSRSYQLAEMLVRSHNKCSQAMLERLLCVDAKTAAAVKSELLKRGIIGMNANAYGIHTATKPFYDGGLFNAKAAAKRAGETVKKTVNEALSSQNENHDATDSSEHEVTEASEDFEHEVAMEPEASCETDNPSIDQSQASS